MEDDVASQLPIVLQQVPQIIAEYNRVRGYLQQVSAEMDETRSHWLQFGDGPGEQYRRDYISLQNHHTSVVEQVGQVMGQLLRTEKWLESVLDQSSPGTREGIQQALSLLRSRC